MDNITFNVNCAEGQINVRDVNMTNYQGGKLIVTQTQFIFNPHIFNIGNSNPRHYYIEDITGFDKELLTGLTIFLTDNRCVKLTTWSKNNQTIE